MTRRRAYRVAYDGRGFAGFQRQPHATTVEGTLLRALAKHGLIERGDGPTHATPPGYAAAGRTDAGVSAAAQTVAFDAPDWLTPRAFNGQLPGSIRVWAAAAAPADFHATHDAASRTYRYHLYAPRESGSGQAPGEDASEPPSIDDARFAGALDRLSGAHDFRNLTSDRTGTERDVRATATRVAEDLVVVEVTAGGFPRAFVRRLVEAARLVGCGAAKPAFLDRVLGPEPIDGGRGVGPAPPEPLVLWNVGYEGVRFVVDPEAAGSARAVFDERRREARLAVATTGAIRDRIAATEGSTRDDTETS